MLIIPSGFGHVIHSLSLNGDPEPIATTYGIEFAGATPPTLAFLANYLHDSFYNAYAARFFTGYALEQTTIRYATGETTNPEGVEVHVERNVFTNTGDPLPQNSAVLVRKRTGLAGRRRQGRMYLPPIYNQSVSAVGRIDAGGLTALQTSTDVFLSSLNNSPNLQGMVILHSTGISTAPVPTPVTTLTVQPIIATQRRRMRP
jgi:hypothetical protein